MTTFFQLLGLSPLLYFVPFAIAWWRGVIGCGALLLFNLLFGWTIIGWFIALHQALTGLTQADLDRLYLPTDAS